MSKSRSLRVREARAVWNLVGECRELGDDRIVWRQHLIAGLSAMVDADLGNCGEMGGCHSSTLQDMGITFWSARGFVDFGALRSAITELRADPAHSLSMRAFYRRDREVDGDCVTRAELFDDSFWYRSTDHLTARYSFDADMTAWCCHAIEGAPVGETNNVILLRDFGRRDFGPRDRAIIREAMALIAPHVGRTLARFADPSPSQLTPRVRQVLACLLDGDGDKQIAQRLGLAAHTVNEYTKTIYRHFGVSSRAELLARWIRRGWGGQFRWAEPREITSPAPTGSGYGATFEAAAAKPVERRGGRNM